MAHVSAEKERLPWLFVGYIGDEILPSYVGIIKKHYKDHVIEQPVISNGK